MGALASTGRACANSDLDTVAHAPRFDCDFEVVIHVQARRECIGRIANISEGGFLGECAAPARFEVVRIALPGRGLVRAEVRSTQRRAQPQTQVANADWRFGAMILDSGMPVLSGGAST